MNANGEKSARPLKLPNHRNPQIGGKGTPRRKKKVVHKTATTDDKKLQNALKKLGANSIAGIEEVNMIKDDGNVIHFTNPRVQASLPANTFAIQGNGEMKCVTEMLPGILNQLGSELSEKFVRLLGNSENFTVTTTAAGNDMVTDDVDDEIPNLVENFDVPSMNETV